MRTGDFDGAGRELRRLQRDTHRAATATDGMLWDLGRRLPVLGDDVAAVQTAASALDTVTRDNVPLALRLSRAVEEGRLRPRAGRVDLGVVRELAPVADRAATSIRRQAQRLDAVDADGLVFPFDQVVDEITGQVDRAAGAATSTATALELLPGMLGGKGVRSYLLLVQNNAELRSTGGIAGSVAVLHADHGRLTMGFQGSAGDVNTLSGAVRGASASAVRVYGPTILRDLRDTNFDPDFPDVARVAAAMLEDRRGLRVDGVLSVDPVALSFLLGGTGPVQVQQAGRPATLTQGNVVGTLLNLTYQVLGDQDSQDAFFEGAARAIFDAVVGGQGRTDRAIAGLANGASEHRVLVWSRHPAEQRRLRGTTVSGELPGRTYPTRPQVGFYLNDATAGKADYYLDYQPAATAVRCRPDGRQDLRAALALSSSMPRDTSRLSRWVTGTGLFAPRGTIAVNLRVYGPTGGAITAITVDGSRRDVTADRHEDRQVAVVPLALRPGERLTVRARMTTAPGQTGAPVLSFTPGIRSQPNGVSLTSACAG